MATATKPFEEMNTLWEILEAALEDVRKVEAMPDIKIDLGFLISGNDERGICTVDMAGATLIQRCGISRAIPCEPQYLPEELEKRCYALDYLARGDVEFAYEEIYNDGIQWDDCNIYDKEVARYEIDPAQWHADMDRLLTDLKAANI